VGILAARARAPGLWLPRASRAAVCM